MIKMKHIISIIIFMSFLLGCKNDTAKKLYNSTYDILVSYNYYMVDSTTRKEYLEEKFLRNGNLYLIFESDFSEDTINITVDGKIKIKEVITTEPSTGIAKTITLENMETIQSIGIRINNGKQALLEVDTMNFYLIEFTEGLLKIRVPKSVPSYY
jgi:hypothetical protein